MVCQFEPQDWRPGVCAKCFQPMATHTGDRATPSPAPVPLLHITCMHFSVIYQDLPTSLALDFQLKCFRLTRTTKLQQVNTVKQIAVAACDRIEGIRSNRNGVHISYQQVGLNVGQISSIQFFPDCREPRASAYLLRFMRAIINNDMDSASMQFGFPHLRTKKEGVAKLKRRVKERRYLYLYDGRLLLYKKKDPRSWDVPSECVLLANLPIEPVGTHGLRLYIDKPMDLSFASTEDRKGWKDALQKCDCSIGIEAEDERLSKIKTTSTLKNTIFNLGVESPTGIPASSPSMHFEIVVDLGGKGPKPHILAVSFYEQKLRYLSSDKLKCVKTIDFRRLVAVDLDPTTLVGFSVTYHGVDDATEHLPHQICGSSAKDRDEVWQLLEAVHKDTMPVAMRQFGFPLPPTIMQGACKVKFRRAKTPRELLLVMGRLLIFKPEESRTPASVVFLSGSNIKADGSAITLTSHDRIFELHFASAAEKESWFDALSKERRIASGRQVALVNDPRLDPTLRAKFRQLDGSDDDFPDLPPPLPPGEEEGSDSEPFWSDEEEIPDFLPPPPPGGEEGPLGDTTTTTTSFPLPSSLGPPASFPSLTGLAFSSGSDGAEMSDEQAVQLFPPPPAGNFLLPPLPPPPDGDFQFPPPPSMPDHPAPPLSSFVMASSPLAGGLSTLFGGTGSYVEQSNSRSSSIMSSHSRGGESPPLSADARRSSSPRSWPTPAAKPPPRPPPRKSSAKPVATTSNSNEAHPSPKLPRSAFPSSAKPSPPKRDLSTTEPNPLPNTTPARNAVVGGVARALFADFSSRLEQALEKSAHDSEPQTCRALREWLSHTTQSLDSALDPSAPESTPKPASKTQSKKKSGGLSWAAKAAAAKAASANSTSSHTATPSPALTASSASITQQTAPYKTSLKKSTTTSPTPSSSSKPATVANPSSSTNSTPSWRNKTMPSSASPTSSSTPPWTQASTTSPSPTKPVLKPAKKWGRDTSTTPTKNASSSTKPSWARSQSTAASSAPTSPAWTSKAKSNSVFQSPSANPWKQKAGLTSSSSPDKNKGSIDGKITDHSFTEHLFRKGQCQVCFKPKDSHAK